MPFIIITELDFALLVFDWMLSCDIIYSVLLSCAYTGIPFPFFAVALEILGEKTEP